MTENGDRVLGDATYTRSTSTVETRVYKQSSDSIPPRAELIHTIEHEFGHVAYWNLNINQQREWLHFLNMANGIGSVLDTDGEEEFCESFALYSTHRAAFTHLSPTLAEFLALNVF